MTQQMVTTRVMNEGGQLQAAFGAFGPSVLAEQVQLIQQAMATVMEDGVHYGVIPGTERKDAKGNDISKPTLLKPGAEKLGLMFRLAPEFPAEIVDLGHGHREYRVTCRLTSIVTGAFIGEGKGTCSTMESKYRYRYSDSFEVTDQPIPKDARERKAEYRKQGFGMKKVDNEWKWVRFSGSGEKVENPDIADTYNTCEKMALKRAHVCAILIATAASDCFTQDLEDFAHDEPAPRQEQARQQQPQQPTPKPANGNHQAKEKPYGVRLVERLTKKGNELAERHSIDAGALLRFVVGEGTEQGWDEPLEEWPAERANTVASWVTRYEQDLTGQPAAAGPYAEGR